MDHIFSVCPWNNKTNDSIKRTEEKCATSSLVTINKHPIICLLDSGASTTLIEKNLAYSSGVKYTTLKDLRRWVSAGGKRLKVMGQGITEISFGKTVIIARVFVVKELVHDLIVGTDIMAKNGFVIDFERRLVTVEGKDLKIRAKGYDEPITTYSTVEIELPAHSRKIVVLKSTIPGPFMVEANKWCGVDIAEGLHECKTDGSFAITLINKSKHPVTIKSGSEICDITKVTVEGS